MRNYTKVISTALLGACFCAAPSLAYAQDVTVRLEPGVAVPLTNPQANRFDVGGAGAVKVDVGITPYLDVAPSVGVLAFPSTIPSIGAGSAWMFGGGLRVKRPHDYVLNTDHGFEAGSPWVDADVQYARTGDLDRAGLSVGAGVAVPTSDSRDVWVGPYVRYVDVIQGNRVGFDNTDAHVFVLGLSVEFGASQKRAVKITPVRVVSEAPDRDHDGTPDSSDRCPDVPGPKENHGCPYQVKTTEVVQINFELKERVQFKWDSFALLPEAKAKLDEAVLIMSQHQTGDVLVEGHASSEGQVEHNNVLSTRRAKAVVDYLVSKGIARSRLRAQGFGSTVPVDTNKTEAGRKHNRRAEFVVKFSIVRKGK